MTDNKSNNKPRCDQCKKKVGLLGVTCRCGKMTCISHSAAEEHECTFDYKTDGMKHLSTSMITIKAERLEGRI